MKKINLFNRNTNLPSFRGNAESPRCCRELVCGKTDGIPLFSGMTAVIFALFVATPSFADPTELDKKTVASKAYVDTKQDIIETGSMTFNVPEAQSEYTVSNMLIFSGGNGITGTQIGLIDSSDILAIYEDLGVTDYDIRDLRGSGVSDATLSRLVPTVKALSDALTPLYWNAYQTAAINAYYTRFGTGTNNWAGNGADLINGQFLAHSLYLKQNKIAKSGYYYNTSGTLTAYGNSSATNGWLNAGVKGTGLVTKTATEGVVGERKIFEATDVANYHADGMSQNAQNIQDISIPTVGAMMGMISTAVDKLTWTATETTATKEYSTTFDGTANNWPTADANKLVDGTALANGLAQKQNKMVCAGWDSETHTDEHCWLWSIAE